MCCQSVTRGVFLCQLSNVKSLTRRLRSARDFANRCQSCHTLSIRECHPAPSWSPVVTEKVTGYGHIVGPRMTPRAAMALHPPARAATVLRRVGEATPRMGTFELSGLWGAWHRVNCSCLVGHHRYNTLTEHELISSARRRARLKKGKRRGLSPRPVCRCLPPTPRPRIRLPPPRPRTRRRVPRRLRRPLRSQVRPLAAGFRQDRPPFPQVR